MKSMKTKACPKPRTGQVTTSSDIDPLADLPVRSTSYCVLGTKFIGSITQLGQMPGTFEALDSCSAYIEQFGGHKYAAGLSIREENYELFKAAFDKVVSERITEAQKTEVIEIDAELDFSDITTGFNNILKQFEPFGPENMSPLFVTKNVMDRGYSKAVGSENEHLKLHMCTEKEKLSEMNGIAFKFGFHSEYVNKGLAFDICYAIQENEWKGKRSIQLAVKDIKTL